MCSHVLTKRRKAAAGSKGQRDGVLLKLGILASRRGDFQEQGDSGESCRHKGDSGYECMVQWTLQP